MAIIDGRRVIAAAIVSLLTVPAVAQPATSPAAEAAARPQEPAHNVDALGARLRAAAHALSEAATIAQRRATDPNVRALAVTMAEDARALDTQLAAFGGEAASDNGATRTALDRASAVSFDGEFLTAAAATLDEAVDAATRARDRLDPERARSLREAVAVIERNRVAVEGLIRERLDPFKADERKRRVGPAAATGRQAPRR